MLLHDIRILQRTCSTWNYSILLRASKLLFLNLINYDLFCFNFVILGLKAVFLYNSAKRLELVMCIFIIITCLGCCLA